MAIYHLRASINDPYFSTHPRSNRRSVFANNAGTQHNDFCAIYSRHAP